VVVGSWSVLGGWQQQAISDTGPPSHTHRQILACEPTPEAIAPFVKVFQLLIRWV